MTIKKGTAVRQIMPAPFEGTVAEFSVDQDTGELQYRVQCACEEGHEHSKWFKEDQIEVLPS